MKAKLSGFRLTKWLKVLLAPLGQDNMLIPSQCYIKYGGVHGVVRLSCRALLTAVLLRQCVETIQEEPKLKLL